MNQGEKFPIRRIAFIGLGLIGGSLARCLRRTGHTGEIVAYARTRRTLDSALELGVIDRATDNPAEADETRARSLSSASTKHDDKSIIEIASDFGDFARLSMRTAAPVPVNDVAREAIALYAGLSERGIRVEAELEEDLPPVLADAEDLKRVRAAAGPTGPASPAGGGRTRRRRRARAPTASRTGARRTRSR